MHRLLGSLGCSLLWVNLVRYLQYNRNYYMVILTIRYAAPRVLRFLVGVLPIMMGYAFFGMTYFGSESDRFSTFGASMVTLFAVLNGDVIRETFLNLFPVYPVISQIYLYSFICLFIYVVLNVFIAIVEEAFFMSRRSQGGDQSPSHHQEMMGGGASMTTVLMRPSREIGVLAVALRLNPHIKRAKRRRRKGMECCRVRL